MDKCRRHSLARFSDSELPIQILEIVACAAQDSAQQRCRRLSLYQGRIKTRSTAGTAPDVDLLYGDLCLMFATWPEAAPDDLRTVLGDLLLAPGLPDALWDRFTRPEDLLQRDPNGLVLCVCCPSPGRALSLIERVADHDDLGWYGPESARFYPLLAVSITDQDPDQLKRVADAVGRAAKRPDSEGLIAAFRQFRVGAERIRAQLQLQATIVR